jgi:pimeloyl-ACP methyl ester carboxylesterase
MDDNASTAEIAWVHSADGTRIGCERRGDGPPLVAVHGGTADRSRWHTVAPLLAREHTVHLMDRRGRGASEDAPNDGYSITREAEDIAAVARAAGDDVLLLAHSYGAICALEAATFLDNLSGLVLYEPAYAARGARFR